MSKIGGKDTKPEIIIRKFLFSKGFRYLINDKRYPGKPDIVLPKYNTIVFINGCFWHGHKNCKASELPKTRTKFWKKKISDNIKRDKSNIKKLKNDSWNVITVWQCEINTIRNREKRLKLLIGEIKK